MVQVQNEVQKAEKLLKEKSTKFFEAVKEKRISKGKADGMLKQYLDRYAAAKGKLNEILSKKWNESEHWNFAQRTTEAAEILQ